MLAPASQLISVMPATGRLEVVLEFSMQGKSQCSGWLLWEPGATLHLCLVQQWLLFLPMRPAMWTRFWLPSMRELYIFITGSVTAARWGVGGGGVGANR